MKKYKVNVNGTAYEVEIEEMTGAPAAAPAAAAPAAAPAPAASGAGESITSPMPGNILAVNVAAGDMVRKGQVLMILEAMKMENEIMAPRDGKVTAVAVTKGAAVESGALLCTIQSWRARHASHSEFLRANRFLPVLSGRQPEMRHHDRRRLRAAVPGHRQEV